ncbi:MAG: VOC family protein [Candidatus Thermoplasmatota archaeon]|nr:VOC family protein [Candidatus Thermoplasmatota archaeon]
MQLSPSSVAVLVSNKKRAIRWYREKLGLKVFHHAGHRITVGSRRTGMQLHLCDPKDWMERPKLEPGNSGILFRVDGDIERAYRTLKRRGVRFSQPPTKEEWGWNCRFVDRDGNEFALMPND